MDEPSALPDEVMSALRHIKKDGATAILSTTQLRELSTKTAGESWPPSIAPTDCCHRYYLFRGERIRISWIWRLDLGSLRRDPWPVVMAADSPPEQPLSMGPACKLLHDFSPRFFYDVLWFPEDPDDSKAVLEWIESWAGPAMRKRMHSREEYSEAVDRVLAGTTLVVERLQEGAELSKSDWLWLGRAWERLEIETTSELSGHSPAATVRSYHKDRSDRRRAQALRAEKDREQLLRCTEEVEKWAPTIIKESPGLPRASIAKRVLEKWPYAAAPGPRVIAKCLDALKAKGRINFPDPKPRGRNVKKKGEGPDSKKSSS